MVSLPCRLLMERISLTREQMQNFDILKRHVHLDLTVLTSPRFCILSTLQHNLIKFLSFLVNNVIPDSEGSSMFIAKKSQNSGFFFFLSFSFPYLCTYVQLNDRIHVYLVSQKPESWRLACQTIVGNKENSGKVC